MERLAVGGRVGDVGREYDRSRLRSPAPWDETRYVGRFASQGCRLCEHEEVDGAVACDAEKEVAIRERRHSDPVDAELGGQAEHAANGIFDDAGRRVRVRVRANGEVEHDHVVLAPGEYVAEAELVVAAHPAALGRHLGPALAEARVAERFDAVAALGECVHSGCGQQISDGELEPHAPDPVYHATEGVPRVCGCGARAAGVSLANLMRRIAPCFVLVLACSRAGSNGVPPAREDGPAEPRVPGQQTMRVGNQAAGVEEQPDYDREALAIRERLSGQMPDPLPTTKDACVAMYNAALAAYAKAEGKDASPVRVLQATKADGIEACQAETSPAAATCVVALITADGGEFPWLLDQCSRAFP